MGYSYAKMQKEVVRAVNEALAVSFSTCVSEPMAAELEKWAALYEDKAPWLDRAKGVFSAGIAPGIASEVARLVTLEMQSEAADEAVNVEYQRTLRGIRAPVELACALGGMIIKPYIGADGGIETQFIAGDRFFPLIFNSARELRGVVLMEQTAARRNIYYNRLEVYIMDGGVCNIWNLAFQSNNDGQLGTPIALDAVESWASIAMYTEIKGVDKLPMGFFRMPTANNVDINSPLGVSVFARAAKNVHCLLAEADVRYSNACWEYEAKQAAIHAASTMFKMDAGGAPVLPQGRERLYRTLEYNAGVAEAPFFKEYSPEIRAEDIFRGYQTQLQMIEFTCGLAYGTISDPQYVEKTAQEVRSSKQRLYATVTDIQVALGNALVEYVDAVALLMGRPAPEVVSIWDDSIVVDSDSLQKKKLVEYTSGLIDRVQYFIDVYGMKEDAAIKHVEQMDVRKPAPEGRVIEDGDE